MKRRYGRHHSTLFWIWFIHLQRLVSCTFACVDRNHTFNFVAPQTNLFMNYGVVAQSVHLHHTFFNRQQTSVAKRSHVHQPCQKCAISTCSYHHWNMTRLRSLFMNFQSTEKTISMITFVPLIVAVLHVSFGVYCTVCVLVFVDLAHTVYLHLHLNRLKKRVMDLAW